MLNLYEISNPKWGYVFKQLTEAWHRYLPNANWVSSIEAADYVIVEIVGGEEYERALAVPDRKRINFQMCYHTSGVPLNMWHDLWQRSHMTVSFHDLPSYVPDLKFNFYRTPLGADSEKFPLMNLPREFKVFTTGHVAPTEHLQDIFNAVKSVGGLMYHTGENFKWDSTFYRYLSYMTIPELARFLNRVQYVPGLREIEGFEVLCVQGAMCGATPIVLDFPTYDFYKDFALFVDPKQDVTSQLSAIFEQTYNPLPLDVIKQVRYDFSWQRIMGLLYMNIF